MKPVAATPTGEWHVAGLVVLAVPASTEQVASAIGAIEGAEVHAFSRDGKLVVTLESDASQNIADSLATIAGLPAVLAANLVYQQHEAAAAQAENLAP